MNLIWWMMSVSVAVQVQEIVCYRPDKSASELHIWKMWRDMTEKEHAGKPMNNFQRYPNVEIASLDGKSVMFHSLDSFYTPELYRQKDESRSVEDIFYGVKSAEFQQKVKAINALSRATETKYLHACFLGTAYGHITRAVDNVYEFIKMEIFQKFSGFQRFSLYVRVGKLFAALDKEDIFYATLSITDLMIIADIPETVILGSLELVKTKKDNLLEFIRKNYPERYGRSVAYPQTFYPIFLFKKFIEQSEKTFFNSYPTFFGHKLDLKVVNFVKKEMYTNVDLSTAVNIMENLIRSKTQQKL